MRIIGIKSIFKWICTSLLLICCFTSIAQLPSLSMPAIAIPHGAYVGLQFGYLDTDYGSDLELYAPGRLAVTPDGSYFLFRPEIGYNFNELFGLELGFLGFNDRAQSAGTNPVQQASIKLSSFDFLALIHLKLNDSRTWVGTPKIGFSYLMANLDYEYTSSSGGQAPWGGSSGSSSEKILVPTIGVEFAHSYNEHWAMTFAYQYYYAKYSSFDDPYFTPLSTLDYFSVGAIYKF